MLRVIFKSFSRIFSLLVLACSMPLQAQESAVGTALQELVSILAGTETLRAEVEQLFLDQDGREVEQARAELVMQKPDRFFWEITEPYEYLLITDGQTVWQYEADLEQVTIEAFSGEIASTPLVILSGSEETIAGAYAVTVDSSVGGRQRFTLRPLVASNLYNLLSITFAGQELREMHWETSQGQRTSLFFNAVENNPVLAEGQFSFVPPPGADIIDTRPD